MWATSEIDGKNKKIDIDWTKLRGNPMRGSRQGKHRQMRCRHITEEETCTVAKGILLLSG